MQVVFLSKNSLASVGRVTQFAAVRVLSLADNVLSDLETVRAVVRLHAPLHWALCTTH